MIFDVFFSSDELLLKGMISCIPNFTMLETLI